jgi:Arylsulfotransferase (ASST)
MTERGDAPWTAKPIDRRRFLATAGAAAGAAVGLVACGSEAGTPAGAGGTAATTAAARFRTEPDLRPPTIQVAKAPAKSSSDVHVFTDVHAGTGQQGPLIIDRRGELAYFEAVSDNGGNGGRVFNVRVQEYRGEPVMTYWVGASVSGHGQGNYYLHDQSYRQVAEVRAGNGYKGDLHEFRLTPSGTALLTAYGTGHTEITSSDRAGGSHYGPYFYGVAQEVDVATGRVVTQWRSDQHIPLHESYHAPPNSAADSWDYFHINSIEIDPDDGNLIISGRNCWAFYKVHRHTGEVIWRCGGRDNDFQMGPGTTFRFQHHVVPHGNGVFTVFDNEGGPPQEESESRGLVLQLDERRRRVRLERVMHHSPSVYSSALGSVQKLKHGGFFMGWGIATWFTEYDRDGRVLLDARLEPAGVNSYRAFQNSWSGSPYWPPLVAVERSSRGVTVYASWNGSTVHRSWRVLGGDDSDALQPIATHDVDGFETAIALDGTPAWVAVQALGENGQVLSVSAAVAG